MTFTFNTRADFDTALSSGSIATAMNGVTSANPSVAITAFIKESGETIACGTNIMVDIKSVGIGDAVLYDSTNKKFFGIANKWLDNNYPYQPTQHTMIYNTAVLPARFVFCGLCVKRMGNKIRIGGTAASKPMTQADTSDYAWDFGLTNYGGNVQKQNGEYTAPFNGYYYSWPSLRYQEWYYGIYSRSNQWLPLLRSDWDSLVASSTDGTITFTWAGGTSTINLKDYDYSYDTFIKKNFAPKFPANKGAFTDRDGKYNTRIIYNWLKTNKSETIANNSAAGYCWNYSVQAPNLGAHEWYLGTIADVADLCAIRHIFGYNWGSGYFWSSTQYSADTCFGVLYDGLIAAIRKYYGLAVVPFADLTLSD